MSKRLSPKEMIAALTKELEVYKEKAYDFEKKNNSLQQELKNLRDQRKKQVADSSFEIDFSKLKAFSIERIDKGGESIVTAIGYLKEKDTVGEWEFYCNQETHEKLAKEFRAYMAKKE
jgi:hypothetical protein